MRKSSVCFFCNCPLTNSSDCSETEGERRNPQGLFEMSVLTAIQPPPSPPLHSPSCSLWGDRLQGSFSGHGDGLRASSRSEDVISVLSAAVRSSCGWNCASYIFATYLCVCVWEWMCVRTFSWCVFKLFIAKFWTWWRWFCKLWRTLVVLVMCSMVPPAPPPLFFLVLI